MIFVYIDIIQGEMTNTCCEGGAHRTSDLDQNITKRLNRIEGQIRGIKGMIDEEAYCDDILNQITAVRSALSSVSKIILENHVNHCIVEKIQAGETEAVEELIQTIGRMLR